MTETRSKVLTTMILAAIVMVCVASDQVDPHLGLVLRLVLILVFYFAPALVAKYRGNRQTNAIFVLNLLTGWTAIGWVVAMVWAFMNYSEARRN